MIRIKTVRIEEFRGIRELELDFGGENFGICGPNGTGKSGVVDAIEFCLTGNVTRLSGSGAGELTVKGHAPHVDRRTSPEKAKITITATVPSLGKELTISRSVGNPRCPVITPETADMKAIVAELQTHPEFALSRREIAKYVVTPPSRRSTDVQTLLRLDYIGGLRRAFVAHSNKCETAAKSAKTAREISERQIYKLLGLLAYDATALLAQANRHRAVLGLQAVAALAPDTSFMDGPAELTAKTSAAPMAKAPAVADLDELQKGSEGGEPAGIKKHREEALAALGKLKEDEQALGLACAHGFITTGLDLVAKDACPLCDNPWDAEELREHLRGKLLSAEATGKMLKVLREDIAAVVAAIESRKSAVAKAVVYADKLDPPLFHEALDTHIEVLKGLATDLTASRADYTRLDQAISALETEWWTLPEAPQTQLAAIGEAVAALPEASAHDKAIAFLTELQVRYDDHVAKTAAENVAAARSATAQKVHSHYDKMSNEVLEGIYDAVAKDFTALYKAMNADEGEFTGELKAEPAKLSFNVDFYGRGTFPPGAYHSEGHQDGMGLCLYLALMNHTLGDRFTFAVLDDVLMSVDTGHRREVCRLLKTRFPNAQFILTTHDRVWLQYMKTEGLIRKGQFFGGWHVDRGPRIWDDVDVWTEIAAALEKDDVPRAAAILRRYLEYLAAVLADNLRAKVEYRGDANYDLGDLLPPILNRWVDRLKKGIQSAKHWGNAADETALIALKEKADTLIAKTYAEQWAINPSVHFNEWENFAAAEFKDVADAFKALLDHIRCSNEKCGGYPYLTPRKGASEQLRCSCGQININLKTGG